jgi:hypothetical protein
VRSLYGFLLLAGDVSLGPEYSNDTLSPTAGFGRAVLYLLLLVVPVSGAAYLLRGQVRAARWHGTPPPSTAWHRH